LLLAGYLPICGRSVSAAVTFAGVLHLKTLLALMGCLFFLLNTACYWTYINSIGQHAGLNEWQIAKSLAIGTSAGLFGALLASWCADRFGRNGPLTIGTLIIIAAAWLLAGPMSLWQFTVSNVLFNFAWNYSLAYQYAAVNAADASGHGVALAPAFHTTGAAAGPAIAALLIAPGEYASVLWLIDVGVILSMGCFLASSLAAPRTANLV
jgi:predicted MFS family arabinose efflux permease